MYSDQIEDDEGLVEKVRREEKEKLRVRFLLPMTLAIGRLLFQIKMRSKRDANVKGKQGVMYINLDGGGGEIQ